MMQVCASCTYLHHARVAGASGNVATSDWPATFTAVAVTALEDVVLALDTPQMRLQVGKALPTRGLGLPGTTARP